MEIFRSLDEIACQRRPSAVTVGNFDGIHRAHQELLRRVRERARQQNCISVAVTFEPHPVSVLSPQKAPRMLTPLPVKLELLERSGIDRLLILPFTLEFSRWPPEQFVRQVLVETLCAQTVLVGENFHFGHRQAGTPLLLEQMGRRFGFRTEILSKMVLRGRVVSSSQIRLLLADGNIPLANRLLGHPYRLRGPVAPGHGIGRRETVPTLNLGETSGLIPRTGVYITGARLASTPLPGEKLSWSSFFPAVSNVGYRPTFGERELGVETHLLEPPAGPPPEVLDISFFYRLRDERKFASPAELKAQIERDVRRAISYFRRLERAGIRADGGE